MPDAPRYYQDFTGTGNSLNPAHPSVLRLIMDSLRYFVLECHVDGFRFDLASALAREFYEVDRLSTFFDTIHQDPVISQVKLIAEPWDVGPGGYQVGNFPVLWAEWNGVYRDTMRDAWRSRANVAEFARRFTGSSDLYDRDGRDPFASINFVTAHDGFTLRDLVSYDEKHNEANGEQNRDGSDDNRSWNHGVEGETSDPAIRAVRARQQRNFLATLLLSQGVPMLLGGDELGRTQRGNNNAWCQDNELSWFDWEHADHELIGFVQRLVRLRAAHPVFRRSTFLTGRETRGSGLPDVWWFRPDGRRMTQRDWQRPDSRVLGVFLNGAEIPSRTEHGEEIVDDSFLLLFNAQLEPVTFTLPDAPLRHELGARAGHGRGEVRRRLPGPGGGDGAGSLADPAPPQIGFPAMRVYLAGPLFTPYEREFLDACAARLRESGFDVFVPHEQALALGKDVTAAAIFAKDLEGLAAADAVFALLDGSQVDDGTACEIGLFYGLMQSEPEKKGIVGLLTDLRSLRLEEGHGLNLFVEGCIEAVGEVVTSLDDALTALERLR